MYQIAKITFKPLPDGSDDILDTIDTILSMLYQNGQISERWIVENRHPRYIANVVTTDDDSLDPAYYNPYILKEITKLDMETKIVCEDAMASESCHCQEHSHLLLAIDPYQSCSPILCGDCGKEIPLIRIPYLYGEQEHLSILSFQKMYQAVDRLWMDSLSDRFTKRQIVDHSSSLNKRGMEICAELEKKVNTPAYYLLRNPIGGWFEFEKNNKKLETCPKCGGEFLSINHAHGDTVCHTCRLAFIVHKSP